jgi:hypothetical protein
MYKCAEVNTKLEQTVETIKTRFMFQPYNTKALELKGGRFFSFSSRW